MKTTICCIEGYSASSRDEENTLSAKLEPVLSQPNFQMLNLDYRVFASNPLSCVRDCIEFIIQSNGDNLGIVAKSMGGAKTYWIYKQLVEDYRRVLLSKNKIAIVFIDAHGKAFQDWRIIPFGKYRAIKIPTEWHTISNPRFYGFYQHNKYPHGAQIKNANTCRYLPECDHWNIIEHPKVWQQVKQILSWFGE